VRRALTALRPSSRLNKESRQNPLTIFDTAGSRRLLRQGGQPRTRPHSCNTVLADRPRTHKYQLAPPSARLQEPGIIPLRPLRGRSLHHFSVEFLKKRSSPKQNLKIGRGLRPLPFNNSWKSENRVSKSRFEFPALASI